MEAAILGGLIRGILPKLLSLLGHKYRLCKGANGDIEYLEKELKMIVGVIEDNQSKQDEDLGAVLPASIGELRDLAYAIEDCLDRHTYGAICKGKSFFRKSIEFPKTRLGDLRLAQEMQLLKNLTLQAYERRQRYPSSSDALIDTSRSSSSRESSPLIKKELVGIGESQELLLEQLKEDNGKLKVVAIVGFCGLGKSALAGHLYREIGSKRFEQHAWVCAADKQEEEVLKEVLGKLTAGAGSSQADSKIEQLREDIRKHLQNKRYFIVIDDIRTEYQWNSIKEAFPDNNGFDNRIVVTTTIESVAHACSLPKGYVHKINKLSKECSKELFLKACPEKYARNYQEDSAEILEKCGGQPLALVTMCQFLTTHVWPKGSSYKDICNNLHFYLGNNDTFDEMRRVLIRNYTSLRGHGLKTCLLYLSMFPSDHEIKRKRLLRRWLAEGFVESQSSHEDPDPAMVFDLLKDRNIIESTDVRNNATVKTCQTYRMMHEYILYMSVSHNFVTRLDDQKIKGNVRRLYLHKSAADTYGKNLDAGVLSCVRSLTIFGKAACEAILDFTKYQLLRVLDLENCDNLIDDHLESICSLLLLKYLSLGKHVKKLPSKISKLEVLEVLDLRASEVNMLHAEVFKMPRLVHLFGKFKFPDEVKNEVKKFLSKGKSKLQTLAGFITDGKQSVELLDCMKQLNKVEVWCESKDKTNWTSLKTAIENFINDQRLVTGSRSLSLHYGKCFEDCIQSVNQSGYLSSLKLHGELDGLPPFVTSLRDLNELCLTSVKMGTKVLEALKNLRSLKYLKLIAHGIDKFTIEDQAFPNLLCLCFVLQNPALPTIQEGSMQHLETLQLLCENINDLCGINIKCLKNLKEVVLHHQTTPEARGQWQQAAKVHPNKPKVSWTEMAPSQK